MRFLSEKKNGEAPRWPEPFDHHDRQGGAHQGDGCMPYLEPPGTVPLTMPDGRACIEPSFFVGVTAGRAGEYLASPIQVGSRFH